MGLLRRFITGPLAASLIDWLAFERDPDFIIGSRPRAYLLRWWLIPRNPVFNLYLHCFLRSDDDRALHDHPWWNVSVLLRSAYVEHTIAKGGVNRRRKRSAGDIKARGARAAHRVELVGDECWTLFVTGPRLRSWGFHCPAGWVHWRRFTAAGQPGEIGGGCGDA